MTDTSQEKADVQIENQGTIMLIRPLSDQGREWLHEFTARDAQWQDGALVVDAARVDELAHGLIDDGLTIL